MKNGNGRAPALNTFIPLWEVQTNSRSPSHFSFGIHFLNPLNVLAWWRQQILKYGAFSFATSKISLDWLSLKLTRLRAVKSQKFFVAFDSSTCPVQEKVASVRDAGDLAWALARADGLTMSWRRGWRTRRFLSARSPRKLGRWKCRPLCSNHVWVAVEPAISAYCVLCVRLRLAQFIFASDSLIFKLLLFRKQLEQRQCMCSSHKHRHSDIPTIQHRCDFI